MAEQHPAVTLLARQENSDTWTLCGALDESVWFGIGSTTEQNRLIDRWCRDAGLDKNAARRIEFRLTGEGWDTTVRPFGLDEA
jgi:hypothetical protein